MTYSKYKNHSKFLKKRYTIVSQFLNFIFIGNSEKSARQNTNKQDDTMRTKAKKFIQNDLSEDVRQDSKGNRRKLMIYASSKDVRERSENKESFEIDESENSF